ncbi:MAG TPA: EF-P beta-lysylation protein EpmB [Gammaproteobacteria bacterium]|nr:EF-P beta-lysylation protein EpmB [Gammaproteobacteria bacterium]
MITRTDSPRQIPDWQNQLANAIRSVEELLRFVSLTSRDTSDLLRDCDDFPVRVPYAYARRIQSGQADDPLLLQVLPLMQESLSVPGYSLDPVADTDQMPVPGLLHKYHGRVLLTLTGACAIHCRYCFRRHYPYAEANPCGPSWQASLDYISEHNDIEEVILSGGDPLTLSDQRLTSISQELSAIPHLKRLRLHTRLPVVIPDRINAQLTSWLRDCRLQTIVVLHVNHANELDETTRIAFERLRGATDALLNQSVLLKGVNDQVETLACLSQRLFEQGVLPYYLHCLDPVAGGAHFDLPYQRIDDLWKQLQALLPGYLLPRLVREIAGKPSKLPYNTINQA